MEFLRESEGAVQALPDKIASDLKALVEAVSADKTFNPKDLKLNF